MASEYGIYPLAAWAEGNWWRYGKAPDGAWNTGYVVDYGEPATPPDAIAGLDDTIWIVAGGDLCQVSTDGGNSWAAAGIVPFAALGARLTTPFTVARLHISNGTLIFGCNIGIPGGKAYYVTRSTDSGSSWSAPVLLFTASNGPELGLGDSCVSTNGMLHAFYPRNSYIHYRRSTDGGATWSDSVIVSPLFTGLGSLVCTARDDHVFVAYDRGPYGSFIECGASHDAGDTWAYWGLVDEHYRREVRGLCVSPTTLYLISWENLDPELFYYYTTEHLGGGPSWNGPEKYTGITGEPGSFMHDCCMPPHGSSQNERSIIYGWWARTVGGQYNPELWEIDPSDAHRLIAGHEMTLDGERVAYGEAIGVVPVGGYVYWF